MRVSNLELLDMKKVIYAALFLAVFTSCKKDRICSCKVVEKMATGTSKYDVTYTIHNVTKNTAKTNCVDYEIRDESSGETITYDCTLKK